MKREWPRQDHHALLFSKHARDEGCCASGIVPVDCSHNHWPHSGPIWVHDEAPCTTPASFY